MVGHILDKQRAYFFTGVTKPLSFRLKQLEALKEAIVKHEEDILEALHKDLNKPAFEAYATEVGFVLDSIGHTIKHLDKWMKDKTVKTPIHQPFSKAFIRSEPYGVTLIIAPFNYPFQLAIEPLIGAIAAGNTAVVKPSEYTVHTEAVIQKLLSGIYPEEFVTVVTGGREEVQELIHAPFDYIFFTGSVNVGKVVMKAAADHLVPVTLELGGKSPTIVHHDANIEMAAKRIVWGKFMNAGQICVTPDFVYVHESVEQAFLDALVDNILAFYGVLPQKSPDYCRIVNDRQFDRIVGLINHDKVVHGGQYDKASRYIAPTVMRQVTWDDDVMADEIFGPILPILTYSRLDDVVDTLQRKPKPLALYIFSESQSVQEHLLDTLSFGGGCINDTISHVASPYMPFGGVGTAGMGGYHGEYSFKAFSHEKSILKKSTKYNVNMIYPPYKNRLHWVKKLLK